jgi:hypothetical protein
MSMDIHQLTHEADDLIRKVVARYNSLYGTGGSLSQVELDLMLDELRKLYDTFKRLGQANLAIQTQPQVRSSFAGAQTATPAAPARQTPPAEEKPAAPVPQNEPVSEPDPEPEPESESDPVPDVPAEHPAPEPEEQPVAEVVPEKPAPAAEPAPEPEAAEKAASQESATPAAHTTLAGRFSAPARSLGDSLSAGSDPAGSSGRIVFQPIDDLTTAIGLNDKFRLVADLFANDTAQYEEAITRINRAVNFDEANWILQKYHTADWDQRTESVNRIKEFVKRRFV